MHELNIIFFFINVKICREENKIPKYQCRFSTESVNIRVSIFTKILFLANRTVTDLVRCTV